MPPRSPAPATPDAPAPSGYPLAASAGRRRCRRSGRPSRPTDAARRLAPPAPAVIVLKVARHDARHRGPDTDLTGWDLNGLLIQVLERKCSDLHMTIGAPPTIRLNGSLVPVEGFPELTAAVLQKMLFAIITQKQRERFEEELELDFAYSVPGRARFRVNMYRQRDAIGAAFRLIPYEIKKLEDLGVPPSIAQLRDRCRVVSCSSPARPVPVSRPRSRASSTSPTAPGATTS